MYDIDAYGRMVRDRVRTDAYVRALEESVRPGDSVLDLGAGTGILSLAACMAGARKVYAIEPDNAIEVARQAAACNGFGDRIVFLQARSTEVTLPEPVDVMVSDLRGVLPFWSGHVESIVDARRRLVKPGGTLIPQYDVIRAVPVEAPALYLRLSEPWLPYLGLDLSAGLKYVVNTWRKGRVAPSGWLGAPQTLHTLDYRRVDDTNMSATASWTATRGGTLHGFCVWFDAHLTESVAFSNDPDLSELIYGTAFFPTEQPVDVTAGELVGFKLDAISVAGEYVWTWGTSISPAETARARCEFSQSTFRGAPLTTAVLRKLSAARG